MCVFEVVQFFSLVVVVVVWFCFVLFFSYRCVSGCSSVFCHGFGLSCLFGSPSLVVYLAFFLCILVGGLFFLCKSTVFIMYSEIGAWWVVVRYTCD